MSVLVSRVTGGLGDILMLAPSLMELAKTETTYLQVRDRDLKKIRWLFTGTDVVVVSDYLDTDTEIDLNTGFAYYEQHVPAPRNRIDLFAKKLGVAVTNACLPVLKTVEACKKDGPMVVIDSSAAERKRIWPPDSQQKLKSMLEPFVKVKVLDYNMLWPSGPDVLTHTSLKEAVSILKAADVFVCSDSGLMHVAGMLGVQTVALFGSTVMESRLGHYPNHWGISANVCTPCWYKECDQNYICMNAIGADMVFNLIKEHYDYLF